ncbi:Ig-like domain-containing protein [Cellulomonas sp. McL0617]|uniref:Ig-like domain-containing protein n=1 Tax=Cellulomonas sp. McL0617 TaxID=3415675 RepID=UPI003CF05FF8
MRGAHRLPASVAALALVVPLALLSLAAPPVDRAALTLAAAYAAGDDAPVPPDGPASTTTLALSLGLTIAGLPVSAEVRVTASGRTPTGQVQVLVDGTAVADGELDAHGTARVALPGTVAVGRHAVTASYAGAPYADPPVLPSSATARTLTVTRTLAAVRTDGTDWSVRRVDPKAIHVQVTGIADPRPTGTVTVWVNGLRKTTVALNSSGSVVVHLAIATRTALVVVTYSGDGTYLPWAAAPRALVVR